MKRNEMKAFLSSKTGNVPLPVDEDEQKINSRTRGSYALARQMVETFLFNPARVKAILQHFYTKALQNDTVLLRWMDALLPKEDKGGAVTIHINSPLLASANGQFGVDGTPVIDITPTKPPHKEKPTTNTTNIDSHSIVEVTEAIG